MQDKLPLWRRSLKAILATLLTVVLLAAFYIAVVMGNPQEPPAVKQSQPLVTALAAPIRITDTNQLNLLLEAFPAPVMATLNASALTFMQGICEDVPFEDGLARRVTLTYHTAESAPVTVISIYPGRATELIDKGDFTISATSGLPLAGLRSVRMEKPGALRMHAQGEQALYVVTLPALSGMALRTLTSTLQLYQGD